jgi:hypothetical protein
LEGSVDLVGEANTPADKQSPQLGSEILARRRPRADLRPYPDLPDDTRLWAALQEVSGGTWAGCVFDAQRILRTLDAGKRTLT